MIEEGPDEDDMDFDEMFSEEFEDSDFLDDIDDVDEFDM